MKLNVDGVYVISDKQSNRRQLVTERLHEKNIDFEFVDAVMLPKDPVKGCYTSHMNLIKKLHKKGYKRALIFEDDVLFTNQSFEINQINSFLDNHEWTIFYLGHRPLVMNNKIEYNIYQCQSHDAHAYIINLEKFKDFYHYKPSFIKGIAAIDGLYSIQKNCYCLYPMLCIQDSVLISQIENEIPSTNYQLHAEKYAKSGIYKIIGKWNLLIHHNHFKNSGNNSGMNTLVIPIVVIILFICSIILYVILSYYFL
jgi:GR25 family glycosyltransferase involved in LPS biosynthesis